MYEQTSRFLPPQPYETEYDRGYREGRLALTNEITELLSPIGKFNSDAPTIEVIGQYVTLASTCISDVADKCLAVMRSCGK